MTKSIFLLCGLFSSYMLSGQFQISAGANTINFETFNGSGFVSAPGAGELDSDDWAITGLSDGDFTFGATANTGDYARGTEDPHNGVTTGGIYGFNTSSNIILGVQPSGSDFNPGTITLRIQNNTGMTILSLDVSYLIYEYNNADRASTFNFSHSTDNSAYTSVSALDYTTTATLDASPSWNSTSRSTTVSGLSLADGAFFYLRWSSADASGSGSRDEFGVDDIVITPSFTDTNPPSFISGYPQSQNVSPTGFDLFVQLNEPGTAYYVVLPDGASAPSAAQVRAGQDASGAAASITGNFAVASASTDASASIAGLTDATPYDIYVVAEDDEGSPNLQVSPVLLEVTAGNELISITEFINNPNGTENGAEWIEIFNYGTIDVDLNGWTLQDEGGENVTIASSTLTISPGFFLILANDKALFETEWLGGSPDSRVVDISAFVLGNTADQIILNNNEGTTIWSLAYSDDETAGIATYLSYSESSAVTAYGSMAAPGVVRNGNDNSGSTLGYQGNNHTADPSSFSSTLGDTGSPLAGSYDNPLPVTLLDFSGAGKDDVARLTWRTVSELNNSGFYIEKSTNGKMFEQIQFIEGNGTSDNVNYYSYEDHNFSQSAFYKLVQEDYDGARSDHKTIYVFNPDRNIKVYPNPYQQNLTIKGLSKDEVITYALTHTTGRTESGFIIKEQLLKTLEELSEGIYFLRINNHSIRLVKK